MRFNYKRIVWLTVLVIFALIFRIGFEWIYGFFADQYTFSQFTGIVFDFGVYIIVFLIWISIVIGTEQTVSKLPWLIILALEPFVGLTLFLSFGRSFRRSERYRELPLCRPKAYLQKEPLTELNITGYTQIDTEITDIFTAGFNSTGHHPYLNNTKVDVLTNGEEKFPRLLKELKKAEKFILMEYYIIHTDKIGEEVLEILRQKAEQGLEVFVLYDSFGSVFLNKKVFRELKKSGVKVVANDPVYFGLFNTRMNFRNHRKITVIDGTIGFVGGMNLGDEYNNNSTRSKVGHWRDTHLVLEGYAVRSLTQVFFRDWYYNTDDFISDDFYYPTYKVEENGLVEIIPSGPEFKHPPIRNAYVKMINNAKKSIKIMTPYIALDQELLTSLVIAAKSGVEVSIIIPGTPDKKSIYTVTSSFIEDLLEEDIRVYKYTPGFCHAKIFIIDDHLASCGSYNLDNRSARINFEITALLYEQAVDKLVEDFDNDIKVSKEIFLNKWRRRGIARRFIEGLLNIFSPLV